MCKYDTHDICKDKRNKKTKQKIGQVELLWTAEPEPGFEKEDILSFRRLERLYPEVRLDAHGKV